ncbi:LPS-assembly lipoprotein LptE [Psychrobacter sp.]|uniref:LPS-assembly lipoprotein LptE n=1 Tax=Psychrobacter sp. TaxID=56811 RepID=UPI003F997CFF
MFYEHQAERMCQASSSQPKQVGKTSLGHKLATALLAALPLMTIAGTTMALSGCGFQLRGYAAPMLDDAASTAVIIEDNRTSFPLKLPLTEQLESLGVDVISDMTPEEVASNNQQQSADPIAAINVSNVSFKQYELVGVLTEIRLVLSADVSYQTTENDEPVTLSNTIRVERSYQYNEASVSTDDQQGDQTRDWLYNSLARRITDQYVALSLPKVAPSGANTATQMIDNTASTAVVSPSP